MSRFGFSALLSPLSPALYLGAVHFGVAKGTPGIGQYDLYTAGALFVAAFILLYLIALTDASMSAQKAPPETVSQEAPRSDAP